MLTPLSKAFIETIYLPVKTWIYCDRDVADEREICLPNGTVPSGFNYFMFISFHFLSSIMRLDRIIIVGDFNR